MALLMYLMVRIFMCKNGLLYAIALTLQPLFFGPAPAFVGPEPQVRGGAYVVFEHLHVEVGQVKILEVGRGVRHRNEFAVVVSAARTCDMCIIDHGPEFFGEHFCACKYRCFTIKELTEMVYAVPFRLLVTDESDNDIFTVSLYFEYSAQRLFHRNAFATVLLSQLEEYAVRHFVV